MFLPEILQVECKAKEAHSTKSGEGKIFKFSSTGDLGGLIITEAFKAYLKLYVFGVVIAAAAEVIPALFTITLLWYGSYLVLRNEITPGELLSFYSIIGYFTGLAQSLIGANKSIQDALIAADRLFEIMDLEREET